MNVKYETGNIYEEWVVLNYIEPKDRTPENKDTNKIGIINY